MVSGGSGEMRMLPPFTASVGIQLHGCYWILPLEHGGCFARGWSFQGNIKVKFSLIIRLGREGQHGNPEHGVLILLSWPNSIPPL